MKTRDRILAASLALLNEEGEAMVSSVDIANALEISPGNLYYHFKGKEEIIPALFSDFEEEMQIILNSGPTDIRSIEDQWIFAYIVLEEIWDFRFFYRSIGAMMLKYPDIAGPFRTLMSRKRQSIRQNLHILRKQSFLHMDDLTMDALVEQILLSFTFWLNLMELESASKPVGNLIHQTVFQVMALMVPHMGEKGFATMQGMQQMLRRHTDS